MMRKILLLSGFLMLTSALLSQSPPVPGNWEITFEDEFDLDHVDGSKWRQGQNVCYINGAGSNGDDNIFIENGTVKLVAEKRQNVFSGKEYEYASGELTSFRCFRQLYGYLETRVKYDAVRGSWPAVWFMPDQGVRGSNDIKRQAFMKFDPGVVTGPVTSASLTFTVKSLGNDNCGFTLHRLLSDDWNEADITWNNRPESDPVWVREFTGTTNTGKVDQIDPGMVITVDVTDEVNRAIEAGTDPGFVLKDIFMRQAEIQFFSKEAANAADQPVLELDGVKIFPSDDAFVRAGQYANTNYGSETYLATMDPWVSTSSTYNGGMEMDILETLGIWGDNYNQHALHWDGYGDDHKHAGSGKIQLEPTEDGFHTYGVFWKPGKVEFYTDGEKTWEYESARIGSVPAYILLSHQLGGWDGNVDIDDASFPATVTIDYVRMYKNLDGADILISSPAEGSTLGTGSEVTVMAETREWGGTVSAVEFFLGETFLTRDDAAPYSILLDTLFRGQHSIIANAIGPDDNMLDSDTVEIVIADPPQVNLTAPGDASEFTAPIDLNMEATAESDGDIAEVAFLLNNEIVGTDSESPYSYTYTDLHPGSYYAKARATDELSLTALSDSVMFTVSGQAIPAPWEFKDIGYLQVEANATYYKDMFYLEGSGYDPDGTADMMNYVYQGLHGDGEIVARVLDIRGGNAGARAGLMMRESLAQGAGAMGLFINSDGGGQLLFRENPGEQATRIRFVPAQGLPVWLKMVREGNTFRAFTSSDAENWEQVLNLNVDIEMDESCLAGATVASGLNDHLAESKVEGIHINGDTYHDQLPVLSITFPSSDTILSDRLEFESEAYDPDGGEITLVEYYSDDEFIGSSDTIPYRYLWENVMEGAYNIQARATDNEGNMVHAESRIFVMGPESTGDQIHNLGPSLQIGPITPGSNVQVMVKGLASLTDGFVELINLQGRVVYSASMNSIEKVLSLQQLQKGIYFIRVTSREAILIARFFLSI